MNDLRSPKEIKNELLALGKLLLRVRQYTGFGDDNHRAMRVQMEVLNEKMTESRCWDKYEGDGADTFLLDSALCAARWLWGEVNEAPSVDWAPLSKKE